MSMSEWLIAAATGYVLLLISFVVAVAVLDHNHRRADRAVRVLRMLLLSTTPAIAGALLKLHQAGLL